MAAAKHLIRPLGRFLQVESTSGIALLASALIALVWANSAWADGYHALWHVSLGIRLAEVERDLHFFVNDVLMAIFFFVVGLEIRREIRQGELSEPKRAALPVIAAVGGMIVPALGYFALNSQGVGRRGWGVPMATDIAFAVGVLALLGKRIPAALRVLLLALAIIDDIGAIIVIAVFYSEGVSGIGLTIAAAGVAGIVGLQRLRVRTALAYLVPALLVWFGVLRAGVHPAIAGVIVGLLTPAAPAARLETALHPWVAFGIMPTFALANAGVSLSAVSLDSPGSAAIGAGIVLGLVVGKPVGIVLVSLSAIRVGVCSAPRNVDWRGLLVVGCVAGIGFTMAIFIAGLAFARPDQLGIAKLAVLVGSTASAVTGIIAAMLLLPGHRGAPPLAPTK